MPSKPRHLYEFGPFCLNVTERLFYKNHEVIPLTPKAFDTLLILVQNSGQLVEKDELMHEVWPETFVAESSLTQNIYQVRKALGEESGEHEYIETVPKRGYRFKAKVVEVRQDPHEMTIEPARISSEGFRNPSRPISLWSTLTTSVRSGWKWRFALLMGLILMAGTAGLYTRNKLRSDKSPRFQPGSMAILPFRQIGNNDDNELLGLGMADALIFRLGNQKQIPVLPLSSMIKYTDRQRDPAEVGRDLGVHAVLDGTVQRSDDHVRVSVQLIDVNTGKPMWADRFDEKFVDIFSLQDAVSEHVSNALALKLTGAERSWSEKRSTNNPEAYQSYVTGVYFWSKRSNADLNKAVGYFKRAIELDPGYALAYAGLADCYQLRSYYRYDSLTRESAYKRAIEPANKALSINPELSEGYVARAGARYLAEQPDLAGIEADYKKAISLNPNLATARLRYGWFLYFNGELEKAMSEMKLAQELDPLSPTNSSALGSVLTLLRRYDEALKYCRRAVELDPNMPLAHMNLGDVYVQKGMYDKAIAEYEIARGQETQRSPALYGLAYAYAASGQKAKAIELVNDILKMPPGAEEMPYNLALVYVALGDKQKAMEWLGKIRMPDSDMSVHLRYDPQLDPIRDDPAFQALLKSSMRA